MSEYTHFFTLWENTQKACCCGVQSESTRKEPECMVGRAMEWKVGAPKLQILLLRFGPLARYLISTVGPVWMYYKSNEWKINAIIHCSDSCS